MDANAQDPVLSMSQEFFILYGSQTGQAEAIANEINEAAVFQNYKVKLYCLKDEGKDFNIQDVKCAVFICSTTGDGDPPENARKFIRKINRKILAEDFLLHLHYTLLGLGDTNYSMFCGGPKKLEKALKARGASTFYSAAFADDGVDLEDTVEPWIDGLFPALKSHFQCFGEGATDVSTELTKTVKEIEQQTNCDRQNSNSLSSEVCDGQSVEEILNKLVIEGDVDQNDADNIFHRELNNTFVETLTIDENAVNSSPIRLFSSLRDQNITLPPLIQTYLDLQFNVTEKLTSVPYQNGASFPLAFSDILETKVVAARQLSRDDAIKKALEVKLLVKNPFSFKPGDSFAICCQNSEREVNWLIKRLLYEQEADIPARLRIRSGTLKKNAAIPSHIPQPFTIKQAFTSCLEIRAVPKKPLLRALVECTSDPSEKRILQELCSKQGASSYSELIRASNVSIMDLLATFCTCKPSFELLAQHLPRLQPRRYSIANSPLVNSNHLTFVFNVVRFNAENGRVYQRNGVCTGHLESFADDLISVTNSSTGYPVKIFSTKSIGFSLPEDSLVPIVMIGPGTGVAPFIGFLEHRAAVAEFLGEAWLFYGCRHKERDFLYQDELGRFEKAGILTHLIVAFSRDPPVTAGENYRYVQDNLRLHKTAIVELLLFKNAVFYVCGDARNMAKDVRQCIIELIASETNCDQLTAVEKFKNVLSENRYKEDIWS